jgi:hypothetical protein
MYTFFPIKKIKLTWLVRSLVLLLSIVMHGSVYASPTENTHTVQLEVTPKPCVALRKGQKCYLEVTFNWQHPKVSNYCLVNSTTNKTMKCWQQQAKGEFSLDFQSKLSNDFALRKQESSTDIARATIPVAWVYKSSKRAKSTWRLF